MKAIFFIRGKGLICAFLLANIVSVYSVGNFENNLVNVQEIGLAQIETIEITYRSDNVNIFTNNSDTLIVKEFMSVNNSDYYAVIANNGNKLTINAGKRPSFSGPFRSFNSKIEIYVPVSAKNISIKTSSGGIKADDFSAVHSIRLEASSGNISAAGLTAENLSFEASSGGISCHRAVGNTAIKTSSGNISFDRVDGDVSASSSSGAIAIKEAEGSAAANTSSGNIEIGLAKGPVDLNSSSGSIRCTASETAGDITINTTSGNVTLKLPENFLFNFSSRSSSGRITTPFQDKLLSPVSDRNQIQGTIGNAGAGANNYRNVTIRTASGSIQVSWAN